MVISNKKRVAILSVLIISFLLISTLLLASINLFSLSKKEVEIGNKDLMNKLNTASVTKLLSYSDKLKLIDYFGEYQNLKANVKNLSKSQINRLLNLTSVLSNYFDKEELGMSSDVVEQALERYDELSGTINDSDKGDINEIIGNLKSNKSLLLNVQNMRNNVSELFKQHKISKSTYEGILSELSDMEYKINLPNIEKRDLELNLNNISFLLDKEKSSYSINADIGAFMDIDKTMESISKELESINYIIDFVNAPQKETETMPSLDIDNYAKIVNLANGVEMDSLLNVVNFVGSGENMDHYTKAKDYSYPVDFAKTINTPKIEIEGSLTDAWNLNIDSSSLCLDNLLAPMDMALVSNPSLDSMMSSMVNVKLPNMDKIINPTSIPSIIPTVTGIPVISPSINPTVTGMPTISPSIKPTVTGAPTISPSVKPTVTGTPTISPSIKPTVTDTPTVSPSINPTDTSMPTVSPSATPEETSTSVPTESGFWNKIDKKSLYKVITGIVVFSGIIMILTVAKNKKRITQNVTKQSLQQEKPKEIPKTYRQMLITSGMEVLKDLKGRSKRTKIEKTPREIVYEVLSQLPKEEYNLYFEFLREFEEVVFYNVQVDQAYYNKFYDICQKILNYKEESENTNGGHDKEI